MHLFHQGLEDEAYLSIALTVSARHHEKLHAISHENSTKWEAKALETLNRRVQNESKCYQIGTIVSILGFIALDLEFPRKVVLSMLGDVPAADIDSTKMANAG